MNSISIEIFCLVLDSQKGVFSPPYSQTARSNCSVAKETTAKLGLLLVGLFCDMKKGGQKMQRESSHISHFLAAVLVFLYSSFCCLSRWSMSDNGPAQAVNTDVQ